ncbi:hypothetical protein VIOR3934_01415 [Vibrio orientalis CIP 102891 = ATCC 33934]|uniref:BRCT domain-containing protein n=1 Tax=Vibrio orientalis CIP 102891 = ATCC 33934 TaxID=675816 RepID=C9QK59_VIBOR|nr:BRCT domain-containing protein [Vibrio orientalis]EEX92050.1 hypothetical protein VIA_002694 [Vibrio orientalis CIP 102891 = ATCC 33934]EGU48796.1 hypothetical protein VIOR3934_01415 [Vibrio orientalis CIP 102891 = ATCC 33934]
MASQKPTMILLSKTDLTEEEISQLSDAEAWQIIYSTRAKKVVDSRLQVCFTGFGTTEKNELTEMASANNFNVVKSVTKKLDFLVGGVNAGPKKLEKAEMQGVQVLTADQFKSLAETGEIPEVQVG